VADAKAIAEILGDPLRGNFDVTLLTEPAETTKQMLKEELDALLNAPKHREEDLVVVCLSCHGNVYGWRKTFYLLPSDAEMERKGMPKRTTVIDIYDLTNSLSEAKVKNIIFLLDICHSGGAGAIFQHLDLAHAPDTNLFIIGASRHDQITVESSKLQHSLFSNCLMQAFEQKPSREDGWLTITDILSFVTKEFEAEANKLSEQERPVQIQQQSASTRHLLVVKNPHYSSESRGFYKEVESLLNLVHYKLVETTVPKGAPAGYYVAEVKSGVRSQRVGIIPYYNQIELLVPSEAEEIALFVKDQVTQGNLDYGLLVTAVDIDNEVKITLQRYAGRSLEIGTYGSIWQNLIDFSEHLDKLTKSYQAPPPERHDKPPLAKVYVPLKAENRQYVASMSSANMVAMESAGESEKGYKIIWQGDLEEEVKRWLSNNDPTTSRLALLAEYGSGKTTFCQHLAALLAEEYLNAEIHERYKHRIPLIIPLRIFGRSPVRLEGYLVAYLKEECKVDNADADALMKMAEAGLLLFLLDGFDEMASRATADTVRINVALFDRLASLPQNKVLLTTRPEYFLTLYEEQQALRAYPCLYLQPFDDKQIDLYLQRRVPYLEGEIKRDWIYYRQQINNIHDLSDLIHRPVLLEMITKTLPVLVAKGQTVNRPNLYQYYLDLELDRQIIEQERHLLINRKKRFEIMEQIAVEMYKTSRTELTGDQISELSKGLLNREQQEEMDGSLREIVTCSFLIRTDQGYRFSHQTFQEYLVARRLARYIAHNELSNFQKLGNFQSKPISPTTREFLLELEEGATQSGLVTAHTPVSFDRSRLEKWFRANPKDRWVNSNAVSLLVRLFPHDQFCKLPLQQADLGNADLAGADLHEVNLAGADLEGADLHETNLRGADLRGTNLAEADLRRADLGRAHLAGADLHEAHLAGADLRGAHLAEVNLRQADLREAHLEGMNLDGVNLTGADLRRAYLDGADIRRAHLNGANLLGTVYERQYRVWETS